MSKITFIFGAGASAQCGAPVMSNFLSISRKLVETGPLSDFKHDFSNVFAIKQFLFLHQTKAKFDTDNMESLFSAIDMGLTLRKLGSLPLEQVQDARSSFLRLTAAVLEYCMPLQPASIAKGNRLSLLSTDHTKDIGVYAPQGYHDFGAFCQRYLTEPANAIDIVSFNYDLGPEIACILYGIPFRHSGFGLVAEDYSGVTIHKLHGSMLWKRDGDKVVDLCYRLVNHLTSPTSRSGTGRAETHGALDLIRPMLLDASDPFDPFLVPPTDEKAAHRSVTNEVWSSAARALSKSDVISIVGYSIPDTDVFFKCLWAISCSSDHELRRIFVTDIAGGPLHKVQQMIGEPMRPRLQALGSNLGYLCEELWELYTRTERTWFGQ